MIWRDRIDRHDLGAETTASTSRTFSTNPPGVTVTQRRQMRGTAMQTVLVALQLFGSNLRKIDGFICDFRLTLYATTIVADPNRVNGKGATLRLVVAAC